MVQCLTDRTHRLVVGGGGGDARLGATLGGGSNVFHGSIEKKVVLAHGLGDYDNVGRSIALQSRDDCVQRAGKAVAC